MVFNNPKNPPPTLFTNPRLAKFASVVNTFAKAVIPTTTKTNVKANATICTVFGDQETWFSMMDCVRNENFIAI